MAHNTQEKLAMHAFQCGFTVEDDGERRRGVVHEDVREAGVTDIVADRGDVDNEEIPVPKARQEGSAVERPGRCPHAAVREEDGDRRDHPC